MISEEVLILGGGMTGLAAGVSSGLPIYEASGFPGGICSSYYMYPGKQDRLTQSPGSSAYRFEIGGGHWIFGGDPMMIRFIRSLTAIKSYTRQSSVYLPNMGVFIPYPIQNHLRYFDPNLAADLLSDMVEARLSHVSSNVVSEWLTNTFGAKLSNLFFHPFHDKYTAGLWEKIVVSDEYKTPSDLRLAIQGAFNQIEPVGYNRKFFYPEDGLDWRMGNKLII